MLTSLNATAASVSSGDYANASPSTCRGGGRYFSTSVSESGKKMVREEFGRLPLVPTGGDLLPAGTELNVVVDTGCLLGAKQTDIQLDWLKKIASKPNRIPKGKGVFRSYSWKIDRDWDFASLQRAFDSESCVDLVSPERRYFLFSGPFTWNDPLAPDQTHLPAIRYTEAIPEFLIPILLRPKVVIAVADTGVDLTHPDLMQNRWINPHEIPDNGIDDDNNGFIDDVTGFNFASDSGASGPEGDWPDNRHATHVAGLAAGRIDNAIGGVGIDGVAKIMSLNVFGKNNFTRSSTLENAIRYAADQRADIINLSLGGREYSRTMRSALTYAVRSGSLIVTAAGNDGVELCDDPTSLDFISPAVYGASLDGMIVTGSVDASTGTFSTFSNRSSRLVEISAPGAFTSTGQLVGLLSTLPKNSYGYLAGTSMAAPVMSGAAALLVSWMKVYRYPYNPQKLEFILKESARRVAGLNVSVAEGRTLDLVELAKYLKTYYPPRVNTSRDQR
jgi:subtilisin family serine protease